MQTYHMNTNETEYQICFVDMVKVTLNIEILDALEITPLQRLQGVLVTALLRWAVEQDICQLLDVISRFSKCHW